MSKRSLEPEHEEGRKQAKHGDEMAIDSELMAHHKGNAKGDAVEESESKSGEKQVKAEESEETALNAVANAAASIGDHSKEQQEQQDQAQQHQQQQQAYHQNLLKQKNDQHQAQPAPHQSPEANHASAHGSPLEHHPGSPGSDYSQAGATKPQHGSEEWHKQRKDNHKEVERRRREAINVGIKELAELIPTRDTNKTQILQRAVEYIKRLKENENNNIEKWTLEKLLTEQAVSELSASNEKLKQELERAYREIERLKEQLK
ncbi:CBF1 [Candida metapsilosis]|uniref:CBF1 n=1 Tax=Candida metapsilosis TaxID=273372 RepID=A0A8H7ZHC2_9ASCO|nr:CBF1 [Candida metapsilosis]